MRDKTTTTTRYTRRALIENCTYLQRMDEATTYIETYKSSTKKFNNSSKITNEKILVKSTLIKSIKNDYFTTLPDLNNTFISRHLHTSMAT